MHQIQLEKKKSKSLLFTEHRLVFKARMKHPNDLCAEVPPLHPHLLQKKAFSPSGLIEACKQSKYLFDIYIRNTVLRCGWTVLRLLLSASNLSVLSPHCFGRKTVSATLTDPEETRRLVLSPSCYRGISAEVCLAVLVAEITLINSLSAHLPISVYICLQICVFI